jgi:integrase
MASTTKRNTVHYARWYERTADGTLRPRMKACPGMNKREAHAYAVEQEERARRGGVSITDSVTVRDFLRYYLQQARSTLAPGTWRQYEIVVDKHLIPALGNTRLDKLRPIQIQQLYSDLGDRLSAATVRNVHAVLHRACRQGVRWQLLQVNPVDMVDRPRASRPVVHVPTPDDMALLRVMIDGEGVWRLPLLIAMSTGMRRGEVLGLQWQDVQCDRGVIVVQRALSIVRGREIIVKAPKSGKVRVVTINDSLARALQQHRAATPFPADGDYVCCTANGEHLHPMTMTRTFTRIAAGLGLSCTLHGLRHAQATFLIMAGIPVRAVSERLGHANTQITQDIYTHVLPTMQRAAADLVEDRYFSQCVQNVCKPNDQE